MAKTISVSDDNYEWLMSEAGKQMVKQKIKVSINDVIRGLKIALELQSAGRRK